MAKNQFKFKLKITGFELEVEGSKEDVAAITSSVTNQIKGLTNPQILGDNVDASETEDVESTDVTPSALPSPKRKSNRKKSNSSSSSSSTSKIEPIDLKKDPTKYSSPLQTWTMQQKALWILYVAKNGSSINELSLAQIISTFNAHFKHSKPITRANVYRDLGKVTAGKSALVQQNSTANPATWYLTTAGEKFVQDLIKDSNS